MNTTISHATQSLYLFFSKGIRISSICCVLSSWSQIIIREKCGGPLERWDTVVLIFKWFRGVSGCSNTMRGRLTSEVFLFVLFCFLQASFLKYMPPFQESHLARHNPWQNMDSRQYLIDYVSLCSLCGNSLSLSKMYSHTSRKVTYLCTSSCIWMKWALHLGGRQNI